jgi:hypothetical protein
LYTLALTTDLLRGSPAMLVSQEAPGFADLIAFCNQRGQVHLFAPSKMNLTPFSSAFIRAQQ